MFYSVFHLSCQVSTPFSGFSLTRAYGATSKREPWEQGWSGACIRVPRNSKQATCAKGKRNPNERTNERTNEADRVGGNKDQRVSTYVHALKTLQKPPTFYKSQV